MKRGRREYSDKVIHFANACEIGRERDMVMGMAFDYKKEIRSFICRLKSRVWLRFQG